MAISKLENLISDQLEVLEDLLEDSEPDSVPQRVEVIQRVAKEITEACSKLETPLSSGFWHKNGRKVAFLERCVNQQPDDTGFSIYSRDMLSSVKEAGDRLFEKNLTDWVNEKADSPEYQHRLAAAQKIKKCYAQKDATLYLGHNQLTSLPDLSALQNLKVLALNRNVTF